MTEVRLAFVGLGWWGDRLAQAATSTEDVTLAACFARSAEARNAFASKYGAVPAASYDDLLSEEEIDGVVLATPHTTHSELALQAIEADKHVFIEKPMTVTVESAQTLVAAATRRPDLIVQVGHNRRKQSTARIMKGLIDSGELGTVQSVEAVMSAPTAYGWAAEGWRVHREELPGGGLTVMGVHMIDTIHYLIGLPNRLFAVSTRPMGLTEVDEVTSSLLEFDKAIAYVSTSVTSPRVVTLCVVGSEGAVWSEDDGNLLFRQTRSDRVRSVAEVSPNDPIQEEVAEFANCIRTGERPETGVLEGYQAVVTMMAMVSSAERQSPVDLDWKTP